MRNQQRKEEILDAIHELCDELQQLDVESSDVKGAKKLVGKVVVITVGEGYTGRRAIVTGPRGKSKKPMYWCRASLGPFSGPCVNGGRFSDTCR